MDILLPSTKKIVSDVPYYKADDDSLGKIFADAFDAVRGQVLKLETRQKYREPGRQYDTHLEAGNLEGALSCIPLIMEENQEDYQFLREKSVEMIRCRPIKFPVSTYIKFEVAVYRESAKAYEHIYWCHYGQLSSVFESHALHDFMVFDARMAVVSDHDEDGLLRGSWFVDQQAKISELISLFGYIKANCVSLSLLRVEDIELRDEVSGQ